MAARLKISPELIGGDADEGYGKVADAFRRNLLSGREFGAVVAVYHEGRKVVDLWGGYRDATARAPWERDTLVTVFSATKGVSALTIAVAASRGLIDYDAKVAEYWPDFAQAGKGAITVRQLLSHQAGLVVIDPPLTFADLTDPVAMSAKLAAQAPLWSPGTRHGYHALTLGWYASELIRQTDPRGRTIARFFDQEIAQPHELDFYIGLPPDIGRDRVADMVTPTKATALKQLIKLSPSQVLALVNPFGLSKRAIALAEGYEDVDINSNEIRALEIPAGNGTGTARSLAKLYGIAATDGAELGLTAGVLDALRAPAVMPTGGARDFVSRAETSYSLGFNKPTSEWVFGSSSTAFGTPGAGGSFAFADPDTGVGFAYLMNRMNVYPFSDPRELTLRQALFRDVLGVREQH
ncbi:serine hydrolase domain-containing protein [Mycobacterium sp. NPDC048908]|uniref:serine hydrolase domain-containing protein n=1 Tax=Mycobacterium sp. NPDC048908 TaxID=3364292 RepID=UPI00371984F5